jgi:FKBP-type peptidyl-prolyl cis-trans isomerase
LQQKPPAEKKEKKEKIKPQPGEPGSKKTRNILLIALGILGIAIFLVANFYPSLFTQVFNSSKSKDRALLWLDLGKAQFKNEIAPRSYDSAVYYLSQAETLDPENPDIQFYYGHALFRAGLKDSSDYSGLNIKTISKASDAFESVIRLEPGYIDTDELNDPYSSLTSLWGSLALKYLANNQDDSARFAFNQGRKRGGFSDVSLEVAKNILNSCDRDAVLFMRYDIVYMPVLYLQYTENYRADVKPVSTGDLEDRWYFGYLRNKLQVPVSFGETWFALMMEKTWETQLVTIDNVTTGQPFTWWVYGNSAGKLSITDQVILDIITTNKFAKPVHYCAIFDFNKGLLNLGGYLSPEGMVYKLKSDVQTDWQKAQQLKLQGLRFDAVKNSRIPSRDQRSVLDIIRNVYLQLIRSFLDKGDRINAQMVKRAMEDALPLSNYPFQIKEIEKIYNSLVNQLDYTDEQRLQKEKENIREYLQKNNLTGNPSPAGLYYIETRAGSGPAANMGNNLKVHYTGKFLDGTKFDSSYDRNEPFEFKLGAGQVIKGWEEGFWLRQAGSKAILIIPYDLGYGSSDMSTIPAYSTLVFEVELLEINP